MAQLESSELLGKLDAISAQLAYLTARQRATEELLADIGPIGKEVMHTVTARLGEFEEKGYFAFAKALLGVSERIVEGFSPQDVEQFGNAIVQILETVRALTQPQVLHVAADASEAMTNSEDVKPLGMFGMVRATKDEDVQKGMAIMVEVLRRVGRGVNELAKQREVSDARKEKLAKLLGPRQGQKRLGIERPAPRAPRTTQPATPKAHRESSAVAAPGPASGGDTPAVQGAACSTPKPPVPGATIDGIAYSTDGHLLDANAWTKELAVALAQMQGLQLTDAHWKVIEAARADFVQTKQSPNIRRLTAVAAVTTKDLYALFPKAPGRTIAKVAGLPKPAGCL